MSEPRGRSCRCGYDINHVMVGPAPTYTGWQSFLLYFVGITTRPSKVEYVCRVCKQVLLTSTDPKDLDACT